MEKIEILINRLNAIGINLQISCNYPWIYIYRINGIRVIETFHGNHGWTIAYLPIKNQELQFLDIKKMFELIRKYSKK